MSDSPKNNNSELGKRFEQLREVPPREPAAERQARASYLAQIESLGPPAAASAGKGRSWFTSLATLRPLGVAISSLFLALALLLSGTGIAFASQNALPSDILYPVKIAIEDFQLALSVEDAEDAQLLLSFTQRRLDEIASLVLQERYSDLPVSVSHYNDDLLQLAAIIIGYMEEDDPRADLLLTLFIQTLADQESSLENLLNASPDSASSDIEVAIQLSHQASENPQITSQHVETGAEFRGRLDSLNAEGAQICGLDFSFDYGVNIHGAPQAGDDVEIDFAQLEGHYVAASLELEDEPEECELRLEGRLNIRGDSSGQTAWQVAGIDFYVNSSTDFRSNPQVGDSVQLRALLVAGNTFLATRIEGQSESDVDGEQNAEPRLKDVAPAKGQRGQSLSLVISAENTHFSSDSVLNFVPAQGISISSVSAINETTLNVQIDIASDAALGDRQVFVDSLGEVAAGEEFRIEAASQQQSSTEDAQGSSEDSTEEASGARLKDIEPGEGQPGQTLDVVISGDETQFDSSSSVSFGSGITVNGVSVQSDTRLTVNISIASNAALGDRQVSVSTGSEEADGESFEVKSSSSGGSGEATEESTEEPVSTEEPTEEEDEDAYEEIRFTGTVQSKSGGSWQIDGKTVEITSNSEVDSGISVGDEVDVRALEYPDGSIEAERIELAD